MHYPWMYNFERGMPWEGIGYLEWKNKNLGIKKAKSICKLFVYNSVSGLGKPDSFNHKLEVNNKMKYLNS